VYETKISLNYLLFQWPSGTRFVCERSGFKFRTGQIF